MIVRDCMTRDVTFTETDSTLADVAALMSERGLGALLVADADRLVGIVTDRDIVVRGLAAGLGPEATALEVMSPEIVICREEDDVQHVLRLMGDKQVRRMPVVDADRNLVGIVSLGDLANVDDADAGHALEKISRPAPGASTLQ